MAWLAISTALLSTLTLTPVSPQQATVTLTFTIVNDDQQKVFTLIEGSHFYLPPNDFIQRENVRLVGWFQDVNLTRFYDFDLPVVQDLELYAKWDYFNPSIGFAQLTQSHPGDRFESTTMELRMPLYAPLKENVKFQWQASPINTNSFDNIGGANQDHFRPFRNGTFQYRLRYRVPLYSPSGVVIDTMNYYSNVVTITIYGQQTLVGYIVGIGLLLLVGLIWFLRYKRKIVFIATDGETPPIGRFRISEDITVLPKAKKPGHRFVGWYEDEALSKPLSKNRMPLGKLTLYAKFKKTKANR